MGLVLKNLKTDPNRSVVRTCLSFVLTCSVLLFFSGGFGILRTCAPVLLRVQLSRRPAALIHYSSIFIVYRPRRFPSHVYSLPYHTISTSKNVSHQYNLSNIKGVVEHLHTRFVKVRVVDCEEVLFKFQSVMFHFTMLETADSFLFVLHMPPLSVVAKV